MERLIGELQRLYFPSALRGCLAEAAPERAAPVMLAPTDLARSLAGETTLWLDPAAADGTTRCLVLRFTRNGDWERAAALYQALQEDLALPAPAVAVDAEAGYQLWLSLAEAVPLAVAAEFLATLGRRYLADLPGSVVNSVPGSGADCGRLRPVPARHSASDRWSAFIDPGMGSLFAAEAGLDIAPNPDRQADLLAGVASIPPGDLQRALQRLGKLSDTPAAQAAEPAPPFADAGQRLPLVGTYSDPQSFLLAVMNDPTAGAGHRIEAAKALLPYFSRLPSG